MLATGRQFVILRPHVVLLPGSRSRDGVALNLVGTPSEIFSISGRARLSRNSSLVGQRARPVGVIDS